MTQAAMLHSARVKTLQKLATTMVVQAPQPAAILDQNVGLYSLLCSAPMVLGEIGHKRNVAFDALVCFLIGIEYLA